MSFQDRFAESLETFWYQKPRWYHWLLSPLSGLYRLVMALRSCCYRMGLFKVHHSSVPVVVVGNITVGGTGKTPFVMGLVEYLLKQGHRPGIVLRGYGTSNHDEPLRISESSLPSEVGDEACMIYRRLKVPVLVCRKRALAIAECEKAGCTVIVSDDGLAHYAFSRSIDIICADAYRQWGSGFCLPVGPLREPKSRLKKASLLVFTSNEPLVGDVSVSLTKPVCLVNVANPSETKPLSFFKGVTVNAVAGIGHSERFFAMLEVLGYNAKHWNFRDHHQYSKLECISFSDCPVVMTEKDAVKCSAYELKNAWYLRIEAEFDYSLIERLLEDCCTNV